MINLVHFSVIHALVIVMFVMVRLQKLMEANAKSFKEYKK